MDYNEKIWKKIRLLGIAQILRSKERLPRSDIYFPAVGLALLIMGYIPKP
jgi:hypothetical protein